MTVFVIKALGVFTIGFGWLSGLAEIYKFLETGKFNENALPIYLGLIIFGVFMNWLASIFEPTPKHNHDDDEEEEEFDLNCDDCGTLIGYEIGVGNNPDVMTIYCPTCRPNHRNDE